MNPKKNDWSKEELKIYILMLCANADSNETKGELKLIKSKTDKKTFRKIYEEFINDSEERSLKKIDCAIHNHEFSQMELSKFHEDIRSIFLSDNTFSNMERNLNRILNNILY